ncbi:hypothetical protein RRF57_011007 [Xylaria bambusicola]|uniref:Uncharacterized protein n=1 Tax=Xylaria bambusicola TaxID=326684 RepID=A0AAN7UM33_9PEZI
MGTSGGSGGTVTTVSTLPEFTKAVRENETAPVIIVVQGVITGSAKVQVASIFELPGSGKSWLVKGETVA